MKTKKQAKPEHPNVMAADACRYVAELIDTGWLEPGVGRYAYGSGAPCCAIGWARSLCGEAGMLAVTNADNGAVIDANDARDWPATTKALRALAVELEAAC